MDADGFGGECALCGLPASYDIWVSTGSRSICEACILTLLETQGVPELRVAAKGLLDALRRRAHISDQCNCLADETDIALSRLGLAVDGNESWWKS